MLVQELPERVASKIEVTPLCWEWTAGKASRGYGQAFWDGRHVYAHRLVWEMLVGPISEGLSIDHLCRNHACVNPDHLEPVTHTENVRRGAAGTHSDGATSLAKTHCPQGHEYTPENTHVYVYKRQKGSSTRFCRACARDFARRKRALLGGRS